MASYNIPIIIEKQDENTEKWAEYYKTHAKINKTTGKENANASVNISSSTYNFEIRYCKKIEEILFDTEIYRIVYKGRHFDIKSVDRYKENKNKVTLVGDFNGRKNSN